MAGRTNIKAVVTAIAPTVTTVLVLASVLFILLQNRCEPFSFK
jgi:hypothetical protein